MNKLHNSRTPARILTRSIAALIAAAAVYSHSPANAAALTWDTVPGDSIITGGLGTWDLTLGNWTLDGGASNVAWVNGALADDAIFAGVAGGVVTVGTGISVGNITFDAAGYNITGNTITLDSATPTITANGVGTTITSALAGSNGLTATGTGTGVIYIDGSNTYSGVTNVGPVFFVARHANALGSSADGTVVASGGTLQLENAGGGDVNINEALTISGVGMLGGRGALASWTGNNTWGGSVTMAADSTVYVQSANLSLTNVVSGSGLNLTKNGGGQLTFAGANSNTYSGTTVVDNGTLVLAKTGGAKAIIGQVTMGGVNANQPNLRMAANDQFGPGVVMTFVNAAGNWTRFDLQGTTQTLAGIQNVTGGGIVQNERLGGGGTTGAATLTIDNSADYSFNGYMRDRDGGAGVFFLNLVKTGAGTQTLAGGNVTYSGNTTVNDGTLRIVGTNSGSTITVNPGGTLAVSGANTGAPQPIVLAGGTLLTDESAGYVVHGNVLRVASSSNFQITGTGTTGFVSMWYADAGISIGAGQTLTLSPSTENNGIVVRGSNVSGGALVVNGAGTNSLPGRANVNFSTNGAAQFSNTDITLNNATMNVGQGTNGDPNTAGAAIKSLSGGGRVVSDAVPRTLRVGTNNGSGNFTGVLADGTAVLTLIKDGSGTQSLGGANTFTGATTVNGGTLKLDYISEDNSKLSDFTALTLGGATIELSGGLHAESVASTTLTAGTASFIARSSGGAVLHLNAITREAGASLNLSAPDIATTDTLNDASGILGTWATVGGDWAANFTNGADGAITAYAGYANVNRLGGAIASVAGSNVRIIEAGAAGNVTLAAVGTTTINTLVQSAAGGPAVVDIGAGKTLRLGAAGGILLPETNPSLTISGGTLTAGGADDTAGSLDVTSLSTSNSITINSTIGDNGTGIVSLTKFGAGSVSVTGTNGYTGGTNVRAGTLAFSNGSLGTTGTITVAGGTLRWNLGNTEDVSGRIALLNGITGAFDTNGNDVNFASSISASSGAVTKTGTGTLTLSNSNLHTGVTTVQNGTLALNHSDALLNSTLDVGAPGSQSVTFTIAGSNTYNLGGLQGSDNLNVGGNTISVGANNATTNFAGALSGIGGGLTQVGVGILTLSGSSSNTHTGATTFASNGHLVLSKTGGAVAVSGDLVMASPGTRGIVSVTQDNQFAPGSVLRFTSAGDSRLELKGTTQTFAGIDNTTAPGHVYHTVQHSEFGLPPEVDKSSQLILDVAGANSFLFDTAAGSIRDYTGGTLSLVKNGTGTQILAGGGINYTGPTAVNAGTLDLFNANGHSSPTTVANGAALILSNSVNMGTSGLFSITLNPGATLTHNGQTDDNAFLVLNGAFNVSGNTTIHQNSVTNTTGGSKNLFLDGGLHGSGTLTINATNPGNGIVLRNNNSTFAGDIIVNGIASTTVNAGSGIAVGGTTTALINANFTVNGTMELLNQGIGWAGGAPGDFWFGALNGSGVVVANFTGGGETRVRVGNTNLNGDFSGVFADGNGNRVVMTKLGSGTQTFSGNNTYSGTTTISAGALQIGNGGATGAIGTGAIINNSALIFNRSTNADLGNVISGTGSVTKSGAGTLTLTTNNTYAGATTITGGTLKLGAETTLPVSSAIWLDATDTATVNNTLGAVTSWTNKGSLGVAGDATAAVGQEPTLVGSEPAMNNQQVIRFDAAPLGGGAPFDQLVNTQDFTAGNVTIMYAGRLTGGANYRLLSAVNNNWLLGTWAGRGESAFFNNGFLYNEFVPDATATRIYTGTIATGGAAEFYVNGALRGVGGSAQGPNGLSLGGGFIPNGNEFSDGDIGELLVFTSVLSAQDRINVESYLNRKWSGGNTNVLPATTALSLTTSGATLNVNGVNQTVASLTGVAGSSIALGGGSLTVGDATNTVFAGAITGTGTFNKTGAGTLTLSGTSTVTGNIYVQGGTLAITGSLGGSLVEVQSGGTLAGNGTVGSDLYITGTGKLSPGTSPGTLTVTGSTLDFSDAVNATNTGALVFELGTISDRVNLTGQLGIGNGVLEFDDFVFSALPSLVPGTYTLFDSNSPVVGTLGTSLSGNFGLDFTGTLAFDISGNDIVLTVVPEPGSAALLLGGLALLAGRRRRS